MKRQIEYLTDAELECLISGIERQETVTAPPDLQEQILEVAAYKRFRFQVLTTVAAAVLAVFLLPHAEVLRQERTAQIKVDSRLEALLKSHDESREEPEKEYRMMENILGDVTIFADNNRWNLFKE